MKPLTPPSQAAGIITDDELSRTVHEWEHLPQEVLEWQLGDGPSCLCQGLASSPTLVAEVCRQSLPEYETDSLPSRSEYTEPLLGFLNHSPDRG